MNSQGEVDMPLPPYASNLQSALTPYMPRGMAEVASPSLGKVRVRDGRGSCLVVSMGGYPGLPTHTILPESLPGAGVGNWEGPRAGGAPRPTTRL